MDQVSFGSLLCNSDRESESNPAARDWDQDFETQTEISATRLVWSQEFNTSAVETDADVVECSRRRPATR